ncbi:MAG: phasin family protein [Rhodocyclaceae bacterium]|nr:phasin family protein [Rhodocyclaceae bacterium]
METAFNVPESALVPIKAQAESIFGLASNGLAGVERMSALNLNSASSVVDAFQAHAKAWVKATDLDGARAVATSAARTAFEGTVAYWKAVFEIAFDLQSEFNRVFDARSAEFNAGLSGSMLDFARSAPAGSETALAVFKHLLDLSDAAAANLHSAVKKVTEAAEANVSSVANAALSSLSKVPRLGSAQRAA